MLKTVWGKLVARLFTTRVKVFSGLFFTTRFHGLSLGFSQFFTNLVYPAGGRVLLKLHNPNNNKFYILNSNNKLGG